jgi:hypothetical protein
MKRALLVSYVSITCGRHVIIVKNNEPYVVSYILKQQWCLSVWAVLGRFFQSLPIPCVSVSVTVSLCVCDGGYRGWGKGEVGEAAGKKSGGVCL